MEHRHGFGMLEQRDMLGQQTPVVEESLDKDTGGIRYAKKQNKNANKLFQFVLSVRVKKIRFLFISAWKAVE
jgi:hypothetical protein